MKLYIVTKTWSDFKFDEHETNTFYFLSEKLAIEKVNELHDEWCSNSEYVKECTNESCNGENCDDCFEICKCGHILNDFSGMDRYTGDVYESMVYVSEIYLDELMINGECHIKNISKFNVEPEYCEEYVYH